MTFGFAESCQSSHAGQNMFYLIFMIQSEFRNYCSENITIFSNFFTKDDCVSMQSKHFCLLSTHEEINLCV